MVTPSLFINSTNFKISLLIPKTYQLIAKNLNKRSKNDEEVSEIFSPIINTAVPEQRG